MYGRELQKRGSHQKNSESRDRQGGADASLHFEEISDETVEFQRPRVVEVPDGPTLAIPKLVQRLRGVGQVHRHVLGDRAQRESIGVDSEAQRKYTDTLHSILGWTDRNLSYDRQEIDTPSGDLRRTNPCQCGLSYAWAALDSDDTSHLRGPAWLVGRTVSVDRVWVQ